MGYEALEFRDPSVCCLLFVSSGWSRMHALAMHDSTLGWPLHFRSDLRRADDVVVLPWGVAVARARLRHTGVKAGCAHACSFGSDGAAGVLSGHSVGAASVAHLLGGLLLV